MRALEQISADGANAVALVVSHYCALAPSSPNIGFAASFPATANAKGQPWLIYPDVAQDAAHPFGNTPSPDLVYYAASAARRLGLDVWLKPHLDSYYGAWRGWIQIPRGLRADFDFAYRLRFLQRYVSIAHELDCGLFVGTELSGVTNDMGVDWWRSVARWARGSGFRGALAYCANHDGEEVGMTAAWADSMFDAIGISAYYPLADVDAGRLVAQRLTDLSAASGGKRIVFGEMGCPTAKGGEVEPWGVNCQQAKRDDTAQSRYLAQLLFAVAGQSWFGGCFAWEAPRVTTDQSRDECEAKGVTHELTDASKQVVFQQYGPKQAGV